ncbi:oxidoreductase [Polynucleobacter sp. SHI8]|uniref:Gfo/Idh/MocA family protein n=1 Tax=unclassified Polynucleobacter TaxID=2640945 RepID=UPI002492FE91|nr:MULTISPECIES: Gfo/Idh/MocA family oxidoreductase [unclassified Polynucleobacter]BDW10393.1 oxidoreductase [Polynucleobacter sp. SHI2]BDW12839.1 oxidoreductase [Polynucleobacter sp. SHI8]
MKAAVIGLGWWGKQIITYLKTSEKIHVTHGVDLNIAHLDDFAKENHLVLVSEMDDVLKNPEIDAIILATPHSMHEAQALKIIAAGKQLFCEKPLALSSQGAKRILDACSQAGIVLGIGHERRFEPALEEVFRRVKGGDLGQILHVEANVSHNLFAKMDAGNWRVQDQDAPAGAMTALGVHLTDFFISMLGCPTQVRAKTRRVLHGAVGKDQVLVQLDFADGATGAITCLSTTPFHGRITIFGSLGWIEIKENGNVDWGLPTELTISNSEAKRSHQTFQATNVVLKNFEAWADAVKGSSTYRFTPEQILNNIQVLEAIVQSSNNDSSLIII